MNYTLLPQKNLEDICIRYARLADSEICNPLPLATVYHNPGFFYRRNFIGGKLTDDDSILSEDMIREAAETIRMNARNGAPSLTTFTYEQAGPNAENIFRASGFDILLVQHGMICDIDPSASYEQDPHIDVIRPDELSEWIDVMLEGFVDENKQREDDVYERLISCPDITFIGYRFGEELAGTAVLYDTEDYPGIMEVAVPRRFRGNHIATKMIQYILGLAQTAGKPGVVLQASDLGRFVYQKLNFCQVSEICTMVIK